MITSHRSRGEMDITTVFGTVIAGPPSTFACPCGEMDITTVFGTVIAGSSPAKGVERCWVKVLPRAQK